jgi:hypothetical protein
MAFEQLMTDAMAKKGKDKKKEKKHSHHGSEPATSPGPGV